MANLKCKYCGGNVSAFPDNALGTCERCGFTMTLPTDQSPKRISAHNGANYYRRTGDFAKALAIYQGILKQDPADAEASFGSALCRFGVEYQPSEDGYIPVCRSSGAFTQCGDYLAAIAHSSGAVQLQYEREGRAIDRAQQAAASAPKAQKQPDASALLKQAFSALGQERWEEADRLCSRALQLQPDNAAAHLGKLLAELQCAQPKALAECQSSFEDSVNYRALMASADPEMKKAVEGCLAKVKKRSQLAKIDSCYRKAKASMVNADEAQLHQLSRVFSQLGDYRDSRELAKACLQKADSFRREDLYQKALRAEAAADSAEAFRQAAALYAKIPGWRDANVRQVACKQQAESCEAAEPKYSPVENWLKRAVIYLGVMIVFMAAGYLFFTKYIVPQGKYDKAEALLQANERELAIAGFQELGDYRDARERALEIQQTWYAEGIQLLGQQDVRHAAAVFGGLRDYEDSRERSQSLWAGIVQPQRICAGGWYTAGILNNGTAAAVGNNKEKQCNVGSWYDLTSIDAGWAHTAGLKTDGTVVTAGYNGDGRGSTQDWADIVAIAVGQWHTVGLRTNGRIVAIGCANDGRTELDSWRDIIGISAGRHHTLGLRADGTAAAAGNNGSGQCDVDSWQNLDAIAAGGEHSLGLRIDGSVIASGRNDEGQCSVNTWQDITAVAAGYYHSVGLRSDGTVVAAGYNEYGQCNVGTWTDIVAIAAGGWHTIGLKADGTLVATGRNVENQCEIRDWADLLLPGSEAVPVG